MTYSTEYSTILVGGDELASVEKIIDKMKRQPNNISFDEVSKVLESYGYIKVRQKGSHCSFKNRNGEIFIIPSRRPIKVVYIKEIISRIGL